MKLLRMLGRSIRDAFKSVFRNFSLSLASISCIAITLIIVAVSIVVSFNVENFTQEIERDLTIVVFVDNDATQEEVNNVIVKILELVDNKVSLNHIFLTNISADYFYTLKKLFKMYNIPLELNENISMAINSVENKLSENITLEEINVFYRVLDKIRNNLE